MAWRTVLLENCVVVEVREELHNAVLFQHCNIAGSVQSLGTLDEPRPPRPNDPSPGHDGEWELVGLQVQVIPFRDPPHDWTVG